MSDAENEAIINTIIQASRIEGEDNGVYFVGPFSLLVSFAAQQNRALNLVYALHKRKLLREPIAIVGGGLAGLMVTSALTALKLEVDLFESKPQFLARQRNTRHRFLHPTVNAWPAHQSLDPTTQLPFLDWCASFCNEMISEIDADWAPVKEILANQNRLHLELEVMNYHVRQTGIALETKAGGGGKLFQTVIFATGFEDENSIPNLGKDSYWDADNLERIRDSDGSVRFAVSGIGDGGLIDSLRLVHSKFDGGILPIRAATTLIGTAIANQIQSAEAEFNSNRTDEMERQLETAYIGAAGNLPTDLLRELEASRIRILPLVWLVGRHHTPFAKDAAPIHKLLVAHAIRMGSICYVKGSVSVDEDQNITIDAQTDTPRLPLRSVVVRHGADNSLLKLLKHKPDQLAKLVRAQRTLSDSLVSPFWMKSEVASALGYPAHDPADKDFQKDRFRRAKSIERIWPHLRLARGVNEFIIESDKPDGWWPKSLFGIPVEPDSSYPDAIPL